MPEQMNIFECLYQPFKTNKKIRLIELFAGYGSQALALKYLGVPFEHWKICEWNYKSIQAYKDIHMPDDHKDYSALFTKDVIIRCLANMGISSNWNEPMKYEQIKRLNESKLREIYNNIQSTHNLVDVSKIHANDLEIINKDQYTYILTYSFPCQDLSLAGRREGMDRGSDTRSGLLWEVERILQECKEDNCLPDVLLMENVPQVHGTENARNWREWLTELERLGYQSYWEDMIATDYGIPQIRNRTFCVSLLGEYAYSFPQPIELEKRLKDMLENSVDEKYYLSDRAIKGMTLTNFKQATLDGRTENKDGVCPPPVSERLQRPETDSGKRGATFLTKHNDTAKTLTADYWKQGQWEQYVDETHRGGTDWLTKKAAILPRDAEATPLITTRAGASGYGQPHIKEVYEVKPPHGYFPGKAEPADTISTVDTGMAYWHTLIGEKAHINTFNRNISEDAAFTINTRTNASNHDYIVEKNLKQKVCDELIADGKVSENDVIRHSYTNARTDDGRVETNNLSPTLDTRADCFGGVVKDKFIPVAQRGRVDNNTQQFEFRDEETANALTAVQKDSMVAQVMTVGNYSPSGHNATRIVDPDGVPPTVMENHGQVTAITENDKD